MSSGAPHSRAPRASLPCGLHLNERVQMQIIGELVVLLSVDSELNDGVLAVWRWTTGDLIGVSLRPLLICADD